MYGLLQLCVLRLGLLQDGDVGVGVFPEGKEVLVSGAGTFFVATHRLRSAQLQVRECAQHEVLHDAAMVNELLKLQSAQQDEGRDGSWVHAYLHRKEGDQGNAAYWYRRAGKPVCREPLDEEWLGTVEALLTSGQ